MPQETPPDSWPTPEDATVVRRDETLDGGPPPAGPPAGLPPDRRIGAGMLLGLGVLALVAAGIVIAYLLTHKSNDRNTTTVVVSSATPAAATAKVTVPRLVGMTEQDALVRLGQVGLQPKEVFKPTKAPKGKVISQNPQAATELARNAQVTLVIDSSGPAPQSTTTNAATTTTVTTTTAPTTTAAAPAQPQTATMPDVTSQKEAAAVTAMGDAGILASIVFVPASDAFGAIVQQAKPSGTTVPFHSHVQINVSRGSNNTTSTTVPNVIDKTLEEAVSTLNGAKLRLIYLKLPVTSQAQAGKVVQQSPLSGAQAPENAQIVVYLGAYKKG